MSDQQTYNSNKDYFIMMALLLSALSMTASCIGFLSVIYGCLAILFALLSKRRFGRLRGEAKLAIVFSVFGLLMGAFVMATTFPDVWHALTTGEYPEWMSLVSDAYGTVSGNDFSGMAP